ncbi:DUF2071 domain-containing protein [Candidatus Laterigemmans baculatus]|uniref:DUF2071 domain-containing protein n=1 Tax=Candidatus Laterigemmans baculatus TaxID=2770505 RepID=UPI0013DA8B50|nr:DUF2071 domain-containing protein [Candidatus Laterigemmans baculatus]
MRIPVIRGVIDRRILVNYRVDPNALQKVLPEPFRPQLVKGVGIGGICLIRLKHVRPRYLPGVMGTSSENAAHRIAVEWEQDGELRSGVYVPRRDTSSRLNTLLGGRVFPGVHHHATFESRERDGQYSVRMTSDDGNAQVRVDGHCCDAIPSNSILSSLNEASSFFECGSLGYSATSCSGEYDGLELRTFDWTVEPLAVNRVESSFFGNADVFPSGSAEFDCALLMRDIEHEWHGRESLKAARGAD